MNRIVLTVYGLKNCDTCRKAKTWLTGEDVAFAFVDVREAPPGEDTLAGWLAEVGARTLVNKSSTTWRTLSEDERDIAFDGSDDAAVAALLGKHPSLIKRPVFEKDTRVMVGFRPADRDTLLAFVRA